MNTDMDKQLLLKNHLKTVQVNGLKSNRLCESCVDLQECAVVHQDFQEKILLNRLFENLVCCAVKMKH